MSYISSTHQRYSQLENIAAFAPMYFSAEAHSNHNKSSPFVFYSGREQLDRTYGASETILYVSEAFNHVAKEYAFIPDDFLKPDRSAQPFVGDAKEIEQDVKEAFTATTRKPFPSDIRVAVLDEKNFSNQVQEASVVGFSINRKQHGLVSDIVIRADAKDRVLLTVGHEIGHVLTSSLSNKHSEEAKAFAFSRAWMNAIKEDNIAGLGHAIIPDNPAHNGLHDVACAFVWMHISQGKGALELYWELVEGVVAL